MPEQKPLLESKLSDDALHGIRWTTKPDLLQYAHVYLTVGVVFYFWIKFLYHLTPSPWLIFIKTDWIYLATHWQNYYWPVVVIGVSYVLMFGLLLYAGLQFLSSVFTRYILLNDQLVIRRFLGIGFVEYRVEMYRLVDFMKTQNLFGSVFGFSTIILRSTDAIAPVLILSGVPQADRVIEMLRSETERCRQLKGIQEFVTPQMGSGNPRRGFL